MQLRPYQTRYVQRSRELYAKGHRSILLVLPTGAGKTILAVALVQSLFGKGGRVLWIVHRAELIKQAAQALRKYGVPCGIIAPWSPRTYEAVQVASIQTLIAREQVLEGTTAMVIDEAHHIMADTYLKVRQQYPSALVFGLTATPGRADGRGLKGAFTAMVAEVQPRELIALNRVEPTMGLVPCRVLGPRAACDDLSDYPVDAYKQDCAGRPCIVFVGSVKYAGELAQSFCVAGVPARSIDGAMTDADRERVIQDFRAGLLKVLVSVQVLTEGFDAPETSAVILASKVLSEVTLVQKVGRAMRPAPWAGKTDCICLDLFGSCKALNLLPSSDRTYSLEGKAIKRSATGELLDLSQCPQCGSCFECGMWSGGRCPQCGWIRPPKKNPAVVKQERQEYLEGQLQTASGRNAVKWLQEQLAKRRGRTGGILIAFSKVFKRFPRGPERRESGFDKCIAIERAAREARESRRTGT